MLDKDNNYDSNRLESLVKILLDCLEKVDLRNFHVLGKIYQYIVIGKSSSSIRDSLIG